VRPPWASCGFAEAAPLVFDETDELTGNGVLPDFACKVADLFTLPGQPPNPNSTQP
jgi:hypothetical protein